MAKSDRFFIRANATITDPGGAGAGGYSEVSVDLGAFVDALGKSVLRIHQISTQIYAANQNLYPIVAQGANGICSASWSLTTQSQTTVPNLEDKSLIGRGTYFTTNDANGIPNVMNDVIDINPSDFDGGYLVAVEQIYLGTQGYNDFGGGNGEISLMLECSVETMTKDSAMALALSQQ